MSAQAAQEDLADLIEGEMEYPLRRHAEELAAAILADGWHK